MFTLENFIMTERTPLDADGVGFVRNYEITAGEIGDRIYFDPGLMRPYRARQVLNNGREYGPERVWVDVRVGHEMLKDAWNQPVLNALGQPKYRTIYDTQLVADRLRRDEPVLHVNNALVLRKDQWKMVDAEVARASRMQMIAWADLRAANTLGGFDGMATPILEFERITDAGEAVVDMDALSPGHDFAPTTSMQGMPLPVTHCDFMMSQRFLAISRAKGGPGADLTRAEMAGRRVGETLERTLIGTQTGIVYGDDDDYAQTSAVYGYTNHPERITVTGATAPAAGNGATILTEWLAQRENMYNNNFSGPFVVYTSRTYDQYLDNLFSSTEVSAGTTRSNLLAIPDIRAIRRLDYLPTAGTSIWVDLGGGQIKAVNGMDIITVQWTEKGGLQLMFKVMTIQAPMIKSVYVNTAQTGPAAATTLKTPIIHVTT